MQYNRTTGLTLSQIQELVLRVRDSLPGPWNKKVSRPKSCELYRAVEIACMYLRHNSTQELLGDLHVRSDGSTTVDLAHLVLPAVTLALTQHGVFTLYVRSTVLEMMREDHVRFARAQGASETSVLFRHALPNSLVPYVTLIGTHVPELIGGSVLIETVFAWPGLGSLTVAVDLPLLLAIVLAGAVLVVLGNLVADLLYRVVDPRVREARA
ncbi:MAG: ABC transporter permease [Pseudonocardiaceae bacterium]